jgi:hypothetical protein
VFIGSCSRSPSCDEAEVRNPTATDCAASSETNAFPASRFFYPTVAGFGHGAAGYLLMSDIAFAWCVGDCKTIATPFDTFHSLIIHGHFWALVCRVRVAWSRRKQLGTIEIAWFSFATWRHEKARFSGDAQR